MEAKWVLVTAIAPVAWGSNYYVTHEFLPAGHPLHGALLRALPAGLLLLAVCRRLPRGVWWWRSLVLGTLNVGAFFVLVYVSAQLLPTSVAATVMATSPVVMMAFAWLLLAAPPRARQLAGAVVGLGGVALMLLTGVTTADPRGVLASAGALVMSSLGYVLAKKWGGGVDVLSLTAWQLAGGAVVLLPVAVAVEGLPPALDAPAVAGFAYVTVVATALAFAAWFAGLRHLDAATVGIVGLLNPVTGVLLGTVAAGEVLSGQQLCGLAMVLGGILLGTVSRPRRPTQRQLSAGPHSVRAVSREGGVGDGESGETRDGHGHRRGDGHGDGSRGGHAGAGSGSGGLGLPAREPARCGQLPAGGGRE